MYNSNSDLKNSRAFSSAEISRLDEILDRQLGPEYISKRPAGGGFVSYIEGWKALNLANHVFGFNGWNSEIKSTTVDYVDDHGGNGKYSMGLSLVVRITLKDGTFREDIGYGSIENARNRGMAFEKCKKQALTDGIKRCLRSFGNVLGNCLYDKDFLKHVYKTKVPPKQYNENDLFRHPSITKDNRLKAGESNRFSEARSLVQNAAPISPRKSLANIKGTENLPITESIFEDSLDDIMDDDFNDIDEYDLALISANKVAEEAKLEPQGKIPDNVAFVSAKVATEVQAANGNVLKVKQFDPNLPLPGNKSVNGLKSAPVKRISQSPVYPQAKSGLVVTSQGSVKRQNGDDSDLVAKQRKVDI